VDWIGGTIRRSVTTNGRYLPIHRGCAAGRSRPLVVTGFGAGLVFVICG